jgi:hypothetical protein
MPNDLIHYSVELTVGGHPVEAMLDSGSTGLRLLPAAVPANAVRKTSTQSIYSYAIGVEPRGAFAKAKVGVGGLETDDERLLMGSLPYYSFSVLYDARAGVIGLKRRTD